MKRFLLGAVLSISLVASSAFAAPDRAITIEKGKLKILHIAFTPTMGANSNPEVLAAKPDLQRKRLIFEARNVGDAVYTITEGTEEGARRLEVHVRVVDTPIVTD